MCANLLSGSPHYTFLPTFLPQPTWGPGLHGRKKVLKSIQYLTGRHWSVASPEAICWLKASGGLLRPGCCLPKQWWKPQKDKLQSSIPGKKDLHPTSCISRREKELQPGSSVSEIVMRILPTLDDSRLESKSEISRFPVSSLTLYATGSAWARPVGVTLQRSCSDPINMDSASFDPNTNKHAAIHLHKDQEEGGVPRGVKNKHNRLMPTSFTIHSSHVRETCVPSIMKPSAGHHYISLLGKKNNFIGVPP